MKSGNLNPLEPSGAVKSCLGIDVPSCMFDTVTGLLRVPSHNFCVVKDMVILQLVSHILYGRRPAACKAVLHSRQNGLFHLNDRTPRSCRNARMVIDFCCIFFFFLSTGYPRVAQYDYPWTPWAAPQRVLLHRNGSRWSALDSRGQLVPRHGEYCVRRA